MTPNDAAKILALVSVYDNRNFDEMTAQAWADALEGLELTDCLDAVRVYYRHSKTWLMPSDLREQTRALIRGRKEQERRESERLAIESANLDADVVAERVELVREAVRNACQVPAEPSPHPTVDDVQVRKARAVQCPWCGAAAKSPCTNQTTGRTLNFVHERRLVAAGLLAEAS